MAHALAVSTTSCWPSYSSPVQSFQDLSTALHCVIASYLHACEALKVGATEQAMDDIYPTIIIDITIQLRLLSVYPRRQRLEKHAWEAYLSRHGASLARLLVRLPSLTTLKKYWEQRNVVDQAIFLQPCRHLASIVTKFGDPHVLEGGECPREPEPEEPSLLHLAMAKGHLPSLTELRIDGIEQALISVEAVRGGHLTKVKELHLDYWDKEPMHLRLLLNEFKAHEGKLEKIFLEIHRSNDLI